MLAFIWRSGFTAAASPDGGRPTPRRPPPLTSAMPRPRDGGGGAGGAGGGRRPRTRRHGRRTPKPAAEAEAQAASAAARNGVDPDVLWALEQARSERTWRQSVAIGEGSFLDGVDDPLLAALQVELDAAREDVGAIVELEAELPTAVTPAGSVLVLRAAQELLARSMKTAEETTLRVAGRRRRRRGHRRRRRRGRRAGRRRAAGDPGVGGHRGRPTAGCGSCAPSSLGSPE